MLGNRQEAAGQRLTPRWPRLCWVGLALMATACSGTSASGVERATSGLSYSAAPGGPTSPPSPSSASGSGSTSAPGSGREVGQPGSSPLAQSGQRTIPTNGLPDLTILANADGELVRVEAASGRRSALRPAGDYQVVDPAGHYLALAGSSRLSIYAMDNLTGQPLMTVAGGDAVTFAGQLAYVSIRPQPPAYEDDCHRATAVERIDLVSGAHAVVFRSGDQFVPLAAAGNVLVGGTTSDCNNNVDMVRIALSSGAVLSRQAQTLLYATSPDSQRLVVQRYPDASHPNGHLDIESIDGTVLQSLERTGEAAYSWNGSLLYSQETFSRASLTSAVYTYLRPGRAESRPHLPLDIGGFYLDPTGSQVVFPADNPSDAGSSRLYQCQLPTNTCRPLPITVSGGRPFSMLALLSRP